MLLDSKEREIFATKCAKIAANKGSKNLLSVLDKIVNTQDIICNIIEAYFIDPDAKFYESYAGGMLPIASVINDEGKKLVSKWPHLVNA
jgi:hypothetical protein